MTAVVVPVLRAVVRDELSVRQPLSLAAVTSVETNSDGKGAHNVEVNARLHGSELELQRVPVACGRIGLSAAPRVGDTIVVAFVNGDLNGPVAIASLHDEQRHPPKAEPGEVVYEIPDDAVKIVMAGTTFEIEADGAVSVKSATDISLKADGSITIEAATDLNLKAGSNATLKGDVNATVEASAQATLKGAMTSVKGQTSFGM